MLQVGLIHVLPFGDRRAISRKEAADVAGVSPSFFDRLVRDGDMPRPVTLHGRKLWSRIQIESAVDALFNASDAGSYTNSWDDTLKQ